jgi:hypothetical protein
MVNLDIHDFVPRYRSIADRLPEQQVVSKWRLRLTPWIVGLIIVLQTLADSLIIPPLNRLLEASICREYYMEHDSSFIIAADDIPEHLCKIDPIQIRFAKLLGLITTLGIACGMLVCSIHVCC